jgi:hypothetical protein
MALCHVALVVVPYDTLPGERHWSWYRMTHCHVKGTSHGTVCALPWPVPFIWQWVLRYHDQCFSPSNVLYGTTTTASHLARCHTVPWLVPFTWQCVIRYHDQCLSPGIFYFFFFFNVVFQKLYPEKIAELSQVTEKVHLIRTWSRTFNLCAMWKALVVVWHIARWKTLVRML